MAMKYRQLGKSGLLVSELCLGTMSFGGQGYWEKIGGLDQAAAQRLVDMALDAGVNFFDTPTSIPMASRRRSWGKRSRANETRWCLPPKCGDA